MSTQTFWLTFTNDHGRHLGVCIIDVTEEDISSLEHLPPVQTPENLAMAAALTKAWEMECNPGGEVAIARLDNHPDWKLTDEFHPRNRLMQRKELLERDLI